MSGSSSTAFAAQIFAASTLALENSSDAINAALLRDLRALRFGPPVTHVYNPLEYAHKAYDLYLKRFADTPKEIILLGMNPGPWGMAQTGVPFGAVTPVRDWLGLAGEEVGRPPREHPKRPVEGFDCRREEVSGQRIYTILVSANYREKHPFTDRSYCSFARFL